MKTYKYGVYDSTGNILARFYTYIQAETFKISRNRMDWQIKAL